MGKSDNQELLRRVAHAIDDTHKHFLDPTPADMARAAIKAMSEWMSSPESPRVMCSGCDGHECDDRCAYPGVAETSR